MNGDSAKSPPPDVYRAERAIAQHIGNELILLDPITEDFIALNEVGAHIWKLLADIHDREGLASAISAEYDIGHDAAGADLDAFLAELDRLGLVEIRSDGGLGGR